MKYSLDEFVKKKGFEDKYEITDDLFSHDIKSPIKEVTIGFYSEESQARAYFNDGEYPDTAYLFDLEKCYPEDFRFKGMSVLEIRSEMNDDSEFYIYDDKLEAEKELSSLENTKLPEIPHIINEFEKLTKHQFYIEAKKEHNNGGEWISFNIYDGASLIYDGAFIRNLDEELANELLSVSEMMSNEIMGYTIETIEKTSGNPSWEKYYEVELSKGDFITTQEVSLMFMGQGQPRNSVQVIINAIDWDEIDKEYSEYCKEYDLLNVTSCSLTALDDNQARVVDQERVAMLDKSQENER